MIAHHRQDSLPLSSLLVKRRTSLSSVAVSVMIAILLRSAFSPSKFPEVDPYNVETSSPLTGKSAADTISTADLSGKVEKIIGNWWKH